MTPDPQETIRFLQLFRPGGPWVLVAIRVDQKGITVRTFREEGAVFTWLDENRDSNLYYHVNPTIGDLNRKADRADIAAIEYLHVDVDPRANFDLGAEQARGLDMLRRPPSGVPVPTFVVASGGGLNALWRLAEPIPIGGDVQRAEAAKLYNLQLEVLFGADSCHNVDRILRLPGTVNWPTEKKRRKGRAAAVARLVEAESTRVYPIGAFTPAPLRQAGADPTRSAVVVPGNVRRLASVDELPAGVPDYVKVLVVQGRDPDNPTKYPSRSESLFACCCGLVRGGCDDETIYAVITDPDFRISESVLDKGSSSERYALRQIERAREEAVDPDLRRFNDRYCVIGSLGGKCVVVEEVIEPNTGRPQLTAQSFEAFNNRFMHERKVLPGVIDPRTQQPVTMGISKWWLGHRQRRQCERVVFCPGREVPGAYNQWRGFACEARPGDVSLFLRHILENLCGGNEIYYAWLLDWMAYAVQKPNRPGYVAIVLRGRQGVGKSFFAAMFGSLWGRHYFTVSDSRHLVGNFNAHLRDCVVLFADEAFFAGDRRHASILKTLITEEVLVSEAKGYDAELRANCLHLIVASNEDWVVPAGADERRYFALDVRDDQAQNAEYFAAIKQEMDEGGREALLHMLMSRDISAFNIRQPPRTEALTAQKRLSMDPIREWWFSKLEEGRVLPEQKSWDEPVPRDSVHYDYMIRCRVGGGKSSQTALGQFLKKLCPEIKTKRAVGIRPVPGLDGKDKPVHRPYMWGFPPLDLCRARWDETYTTKTEWETDEINEPEHF